jgi:gluconokinase
VGAPVDERATTTLVLAGVAGVGKSAVGHRLVDRLGWAFAEGDDFHPPENVAKMKQGHALTDGDRWPWLGRLAHWIGEREAAGENAVLTSSALKRAYRDLLAEGHPSVRFVQLTARAELLAERLDRRRDHYLPASLLPSQLHDLEALGPDERGTVVGCEGTPDEVARQVIGALGLDPAPPVEPTPATTQPAAVHG